MGGDVTVHQPGAGIVGLEGHDHVTVQRHGGDVTPRRVREGQVHCVVQGAEALGDDKVVVPVEVHGVGTVAVGDVLDAKVDPLVRHAQGDGVVVGEAFLRGVARVGPGGVVVVDHQVRRGREVDPDVGAVEREQEPGRHGDKSVVQVQERNGVRGGHVQGHVRDELVVGLVLAVEGVVGGRVGRRGQRRGVGDAGVAHDTQRVVPRVVVAAGSLPDGSEPIVVRGCIGFDDDVVPLAHGDDETVGRVGLEGHKIHGDDRQAVAVNGEAEVRVQSRVDEAEAVLLARLKGHLEPFPDRTFALALRRVVLVAVEDVGAVDERVGLRGGAGRRSVPPPLVESRDVSPVHEHQCPQVFIVVRGGWSIDHDGTKETRRVLEAKVRMVP